jgi:hypothetical protein
MVLGRDLDDPVPAFGRADHAPQGGDVLAVQKACGHAVGCNHEILDDLLGPVGLIHLQILDLISGKDRAGFQRLQGQGTVLMTQGS